MTATSTENICSVSDFLKRGHYVVPFYQRGYKWSLLPCSSGKTHLEQLLIDLCQAYDAGAEDYHLQGVTVKAESGRFELIDGQQRTTSLYLILLWSGGREDLLRGRLDYQVRGAVKSWLSDKLEGKPGQVDDSIQDVEAMQRAWYQIETALRHRNDLPKFIDFLLHRVLLIVLTIDQSLKTTQVFSMMNKDKAVMMKTDLIKARLLSEISRAELKSADPAVEIPVAQRRNQLAHIWDRWRLWWEDDAHAKFFGKALSCPEGEPPMARLLRWKLGPEKEDLYAACDLLSEDAQTFFESLQEWQEVLQEWYDDAKIHNAIGLLLFGGRGDAGQKGEALKFLCDLYLGPKEADFLEKAKDIACCSLVTELTQKLLNSLVGSIAGPQATEDARDVLNRLLGSNVYNEAKDDAFRQLLRINIDYLPKSERFPFVSLQGVSSLEHIHPKSRVISGNGKTYETDKAETAEADINKDATGYLNFHGRTDNISEHCIGNLVLLSVRDNSAVGTKGLDDKRRIIFERLNKSTLLLHTLRVFAKTNSNSSDSAQWGIADIIANRDDFAADFRRCYKLPEEDKA